MTAGLLNWLSRLPLRVAPLPSQCMLCRAWPSQPLCDRCVRRFAAPVPRCRTCALPLEAGTPGECCGTCRLQPPPLARCFAACAYVWPWNRCIARFKFDGDAGLAPALAGLMRSGPWIEPAVEAAELILPMPLAAQRLRARGFNQAHELARRLGAPRKCQPHLLQRVRDDPPQSGLPRAQRLRNLQGAFALSPGAEARVRGRRLLLVDDVMTTGASLHAAAGVLLAAGAASVEAVVLARTPAPGGA